MRNIGVGLFVAAYGVLFFTSSTVLAYTRARPHYDPMMLAVAVAGIALAVIPVRRGEPWALQTEVVILVVVLTARFGTLGTRLTLDPQGKVIPDPNQPGGLPLVVASALAVAGLFLCSGKPWFMASSKAQSAAQPRV